MATRTPQKSTTRKPAKKTAKKAAKKTAKKAAKKKPAKKAKKKKTAKQKLDDMLSVPNLLKRAAKSEEERLARAAALEGKHEERLRPVDTPIRPCNPPHWGYGFSFDAAVDEETQEKLKSFCSRFTKIARDRGNFLVVGPQTTPEQRRIDWEFGVVIEAEQLLAHVPPDDEDARTALLDKALGNMDKWSDVVMLLSTWPEAGLPAAIARAEAGLAAWPDVLRYCPDAWKKRPELRALCRTLWLGKDEDPDEEVLEHATVLQTQNVEAVERLQRRLGKIKTLVLSGQVDLDDFVVKLTALTSLVQLELSQPSYSHGTADIDLKKVLAAPHLQNLTALSLYGYTLPKASLDALANAEQPLERLKIQYGKMKPSAADSLAKLVTRRPLVSLDLKYNDLGPKGAEKLFSVPAWSRLRALDFSANEIGDRGAAAIAAAELPELRWLNLSSNDTKEPLTEKAAASLASAAAMPKLHSLNLFGHPLKAEGVAALLHAPGLRALRELDCSYSSTSVPELMKHLAQARGEPLALEKLGLQSTDRPGAPADWSVATFLQTVRVLNIESLDAKGIAAFLACPHLDNLEILVLGCAYGEEKQALQAIAAASPPPKLRWLGLNGHKLDGETASLIAHSPIGRQLWGLELMESYTQPAAWRACYDAGLPLVGYVHFNAYVANEHSPLTTWREEI